MALVDTHTGSVAPTSLAEHEAVIERGLASFVEVGNALLAIKVDKLYRQSGYSTFEDYCQRRWDISRSRGYQLVTAAATVEALARSLPETSTIVDIPLPTAEGQVRPLTEVEPEERPEVWASAVSAAGGEVPTAAQVQAAVDQRLGRPTKVTERESRSTTYETPPANVDPQTGEVHRPMTADAYRKHLQETDPDLILMQWRANFASAAHALSKLMLFPAETVAERIEQEDFEVLGHRVHDLVEWLGQIESRRPKGLRVVSGGAR